MITGPFNIRGRKELHGFPADASGRGAPFATVELLAFLSSVKMAESQNGREGVGVMAAEHDTDRLALAGNFLVASPRAGPRFHQRVVLLFTHDQSGAQGILLNDEFARSLGRLKQQLNNLSPPAARRSLFPGELKVRVVRWAPGELDQEYEQGVWMTTPATLERLHDANCTGNLWFDLVRHIGRSVLSESLNIQEFPKNPAWN